MKTEANAQSRFSRRHFLTAAPAGMLALGIQPASALMLNDPMPRELDAIQFEVVERFMLDAPVPIEMLTVLCDDVRVLAHDALPDSAVEVERLDGQRGLAFLSWVLSGYFFNVAFPDGEIHTLVYRMPFEADMDVSPLEVQSGARLPRYANLIPASDYMEHGTVTAPHSRAKTLAPKSASLAPFGSPIGEYNGVIFYSNAGNEKTNKYGYNVVNGYNCGPRYHCTEGADRYFLLRFGKKITGGNANTYYSNASSKGLNRAGNDGTNGPQTGNILVSEYDLGHLMVVREVSASSGYVAVIQQNWANTSADNYKKLNMTVTKAKDGLHYKIAGPSNSYSIKGWLWPK